MSFTFTFKVLDPASADAILAWRYPAPYDIYNADPNDLEVDRANLLDPVNLYFGVWNAENTLIGFRNYGPDAQVPGGDYLLEALDLGGGLRPDLTGRGLGPPFMQAAFDFARSTFKPAVFRATVAAFNMRARTVCERVGYTQQAQFSHAKDGRDFIIYTRPA